MNNYELFDYNMNTIIKIIDDYYYNNILTKAINMYKFIYKINNKILLYLPIPKIKIIKEYDYFCKKILYNNYFEIKIYYTTHYTVHFEDYWCEIIINLNNNIYKYYKYLYYNYIFNEVKNTLIYNYDLILKNNKIVKNKIIFNISNKNKNKNKNNKYKYKYKYYIYFYKIYINKSYNCKIVLII